VPTLDARLAELRDSGCRQLIVDLGRLEFIDSTGLRLLLQYDAEAPQDGFSFSLTRGPAAVQRVFELSGTHGLLTFHRLIADDFWLAAPLRRESRAH
jgi:anti-sigma B factor antagonist